MVLQYLHQEIVIISYLSNFLIRWMFPFLAACQYYSVILFGFRLIKTCLDQNHHHKDTLLASRRAHLVQRRLSKRISLPDLEQNFINSFQSFQFCKFQGVFGCFGTLEFRCSSKIQWLQKMLSKPVKKINLTPFSAPSPPEGFSSRSSCSRSASSLESAVQVGSGFVGRVGTGRSIPRKINSQLQNVNFTQSKY